MALKNLLGSFKEIVKKCVCVCVCVCMSIYILWIWKSFDLILIDFSSLTFHHKEIEDLQQNKLLIPLVFH